IRLLKRRIAEGDYALGELPGEHSLAAELGAGRMTVRRAVVAMIEEGVLTRAPSRRLIVNTAADHPAVRQVVGYLAPAFASPVSERMHYLLNHVAARQNVRLRPVDYVHDDDPAIVEALNGFGGVVVEIHAGAPLERWIERLTSAAARVVSLSMDLSAHGIVSICLDRPDRVAVLLERLKTLGHRRVDCLNVQPAHPVIAARIDAWRTWCDAAGVSGVLHDEPVASFEQPIAAACDMTKRLLDGKALKATALFCTTEPGALGAMRALADRGLQPGRDVSVCTACEEYAARYVIPTLTTLRMADPRPYFRRCLEWLCSDSPWKGRRLVRPRPPQPIFGDSIGPAPRDAPV
ncbi:MAG: LacI family DNA-binding transcriptional regulator, partial [Phycisphaerae bacterium]|nr:LacI family DNA-binding transcriptional regulator [Phycisphaerae bacterium]